MLRGILTVGGWTLISRILGFARDMLIAALIGTGPIADAFFVALKLPEPVSPPVWRGRLQRRVHPGVLRAAAH